MAGNVGVDIDLGAIDHDDWPMDYDVDATLLFSESCTRFLVEVEQGKKFNFQTKMMGTAATPIGRFSKKNRMTVKSVTGRPLVDLGLDEIREAFQSGFRGNAGPPVPKEPWALRTPGLTAKAAAAHE